MTNLFQNLFQMSGMPIKVVLDTKKKLSPFSEVLQYKPSNYSLFFHSISIHVNLWSIYLKFSFLAIRSLFRERICPEDRQPIWILFLVYVKGKNKEKRETRRRKWKNPHLRLRQRCVLICCNLLPLFKYAISATCLPITPGFCLDQ